MHEKVALKTIIDRYNKITDIRTRRAIVAMSSAARHFFSIIPVLLQYNHPILPGYIPGNTPHGICDFHLSPSQQDYIDRMCNVSNCNIESYIESPAIISLYCMGSTSSVGQSTSSDLDIWVCHSHTMDKQDVKKLEQKCGVLTNVAQNLGIDVNFFLVEDDQFRRASRSSVDKENCGSSLHLLLLEEFYRSSLWMAGKKLVWYLVTEDHDKSTKDYDNYVKSLFHDGLIKSSQWFDLGPINHIPAKEFFGSAMWLLYKGVDSPFKAVIKIMLMESYASEYPDVRLVANQIRLRQQQSDEYDTSLDSYYQVYEKIINYLNKIEDKERPEVVKSCFIMKVANGLDEADKSVYMQWRINLVQDLIKSSAMDEVTVAHLRDHRNWKIADVVAAYRMMTKVMLQCSNRLRSFSNRVQKMGSPIDITDFQILTQKLSSAFEYKLDKIVKVNLNIAPSVHEKNISLVYVIPGKLNRSGWYLFPSSLEPYDVVRHKCVYFHKNVVNVLVWAIINGVLDSSTVINVSSNASSDEVQTLRLLAKNLLDEASSLKGLEVSNKDLIGPMYFKHLLLMVNVSIDDTKESDKNELNLKNIDVLSFGSEKKSLVSSMDIIFRNSWGELYVKHFEGDEELIQGLTEMLNIRKPGTTISRIPTFSVYCYSKHLNGIIRQQISDLISDFMVLAHSSGERNSSMVFMLGDTSYSAIRNHKNVTIAPLRNSLDFVETIHAMQVEMAEERGRSPSIEKIYQYACKGVVQFFFEQTDRECMVYVLDENNQLKSYLNSDPNCDALVNRINKTYTERILGLGGAVSVHNAHFEVPQFYQLHYDGDQIIIDNYRAEKSN